MKGHAHSDPLHIDSEVMIFAGLIVIAASWRTLLRAQRTGTLAATGPYGWMRHPQYAAFIFIMFGFLLQWPTIPTLLMFPILVVMYVRLARKEEAEIRAEFGEAYDRDAETPPAFVP